MRTRIKFCGCTDAAQAQDAVDSGADALGVIFATTSERFVDAHAARDIARAVPPFVALVGVFVDPSAEQVAVARAAGYTPQFCGAETPEFCERAAGASYIKVHHVRPGSTGGIEPDAFHRSAQAFRHATWMFDTRVEGKHGGTGRSFDWNIVRAVAATRRVIISGGLSADNVGACIRQIRPYGVDVRSGIETDGVKDLAKMRAFVRAVKDADAQA